MDLIVTDCFAGARTPAHLTSVEFVRQASAALVEDGVYAANIGDASSDFCVFVMPYKRKKSGRTRDSTRTTVAP